VKSTPVRAELAAPSGVRILYNYAGGQTRRTDQSLIFNALRNRHKYCLKFVKVILVRVPGFGIRPAAIGFRWFILTA
jgi:hypothetical protein